MRIKTSIAILFLLSLSSSDVVGVKKATNPPHVVFIVADDLGWNDVGYHNPQLITPNIDKLARAGVILNSSYVQPVCSPTRNCFMTGYFPFHTGLQHGVIRPSEPHCLPLNYTLLPQKLKELGYQTHMVGKWHLGFCNKDCVPTSRGFDSFLGYYTGAEDYFFHDRKYLSESGYDFRFNVSINTKDNGTYSAHAFAKRAIDIIASHDETRPLYLYLPFQSVHEPLQVPQKYENMYRGIHNEKRRTFCGMVSALDEAIGNITRALDEKGLMDNLLLVFTTDNGGPVLSGANNLPLRGSKHTLWEGGTKGAGFIYSHTLLQRTGFVQTGLFHAVDWYPTLVTMAGGNPDDKMDGVDQWEMLKTGTSKSKRNEFVHNIDQCIPNAAIRVGDYKLLVGDPGKPDDWAPLPTIDNSNGTVEETLDHTSCFSEHRNFLFDKNTKVQLFNISSDPTEHYDIAGDHPEIVSRLKDRLEFYMKSAVTPSHPPPDPKSDPKNFGGNWGPGWC